MSGRATLAIASVCLVLVLPAPATGQLQASPRSTVSQTIDGTVAGDTFFNPGLYRGEDFFTIEMGIFLEFSMGPDHASSLVLRDPMDNFLGEGTWLGDSPCRSG